MKRFKIVQLTRRFILKIRDVGFYQTFRLIYNHVLERHFEVLPLSRADPSILFATNTEEIRARGKKQMRTTSMLYEASHMEDTYPLIFRWNSHLMRYAYLPAIGQSKGLVVLFHGHNAYLHLGPIISWQHFDILAPWDTFGWRRQGSWFWGEKGKNFVEQMVCELIDKHREEFRDRPWFCIGGSMGGFAALYHGIKYRCDGLYVTAPQVDLQAKVIDYGRENRDNPYGYLQGEKLEAVPDLFSLAEKQQELPPLFLIQNQYDPVNRFADHAFRLLKIYNTKNAWYGVRVYPAIGHGGDGSQREAELFFSMIVDKAPPKRVPF